MAKEEDIRFKIDAEDAASAKIRKVNTETKALTKNVQQSGGQFRASTELVGTFATVLGNAGFGGAAGDVAQLTERVTAFTSAAGESRMLLKAGVFAGVAFGAFQLGQALSGTHQDAKILNDELTRTEQIVLRLEKAEGIRESFSAFQISLLPSTEFQLEAMTEEMEMAAKNLSSTAGLLSQAREDLAAFERGEVGRAPKSLNEGQFGFVTFDPDELKKTIEREEKIYADRLTAQTARQAAIERFNAQSDSRDKQRSRAFIQRLQDELDKVRLSASEFERVQAFRNTQTPEQFEAAQDLIGRKNFLLEQQELEKQIEADKKKAAQEADRAEQKRIQALQRIADLQTSTVEGLKLQAIELTSGAEAAEAMRLQMQGIEAGAAGQIAGFRTQIENARKLRDATSTPASDLQAKNQRLLSGRGESRQHQLIQQTTKSANENAKTNAKMDTLIGKLDDLITATEAKETFNVVGD